jgi:hypothetical protein
MKSIHFNVLYAMTTATLACSGAGGESSLKGGDGGASGSSVADLETKSGADAGDSTPFLGTWPGSFSMNENCPTSLPTMSSRADTLVVTAGPAEAGAGVISVLTEDGCTFDYTVDGDLATALPNQRCPGTEDASMTEAVISRTLTLGGGQLNEIGTVTVTQNGVTCSQTEQGTYTQ